MYPSWTSGVSPVDYSASDRAGFAAVGGTCTAASGSTVTSAPSAPDSFPRTRRQTAASRP
jgi:hypothetical protein